MKASVLYVVPPSDSFAGIERVTHEIANSIASQYADRLDVSVLYCSPFKELDKIDIKYKLVQGNIKRLYQMVSLIRSVMRQNHYDTVVVSQVEASTMVWLAGVFYKTKFVIWLHGNPSIERQSRRSAFLFNLFERIAARRFAGAFVVAPSQTVFFEPLTAFKGKVSWVPNPLREFSGVSCSPPHHRNEQVRFLSVGRLAHQKGFDDLLQAFALMCDDVPGATLEIVGYGPDRGKLDGIIKRLNLEGRATISDMGSEPDRAYSRSDIFVSSSRWEGWSLVIVEALSFGLPVIAMDCDYGPRDILTDADLGSLVERGDVPALARCMTNFALNLTDRRHKAQYRRDYAMQFRADRVVQRHFAALVALEVGHA